ncbi:hypothetical protein Q4R49_17500 [Morganella morganii subsp. sibonii]
MMKMTVLRAFYFGHRVVVEGEEIETTELHGRELIQKGYAGEIPDNILPEPEPEPEKPAAPESKRGAKGK